MRAALLQRELALAAVALVAVVLALAVAALAEDSSGQPSPPGSVAPAEGDWYTALAAPYRVDRTDPLTRCGQPARVTLLGVAHPVLPCGAKVVVRYGDAQVLTQVVDRGSGRPGREFELTAALAARLELRGTQEIEWRFAAR